MSDSNVPAQRSRAASAVLHGVHPLRGYPVTWRLTPLPSRRGEATFLVERADGHIETDMAWAPAEKDTRVMTATELSHLVRRASAAPRR